MFCWHLPGHLQQKEDTSPKTKNINFVVTSRAIKITDKDTPSCLRKIFKICKLKIKPRCFIFLRRKYCDDTVHGAHFCFETNNYDQDNKIKLLVSSARMRSWCSGPGLRGTMLLKHISFQIDGPFQDV